MKELFIKISRLKVIVFLRKNYLWAILIGFIPALCTFPPNIINSCRANGTIVKIYDKDIWFIIINHTYDNIGGFAGGKTSYGGNGIEYMPTMRLNITRTGFVKLREVKRGQSGFGANY